MSLEDLSYAAQIFGVVGVILSLVFVGWQVRQNTAALRRSEHNATQGEWLTIRMAVATDRGLVELVSGGLYGERKLDAADQLRLEHFLSEYAWAGFHIWDRTQRGVFPPGTFELTAGPLLADVLSTNRGRAWWTRVKGAGFIPAYAADVDAVLAGAPAQCPAPASCTSRTSPAATRRRALDPARRINGAFRPVFDSLRRERGKSRVPPVPRNRK